MMPRRHIVSQAAENVADLLTCSVCLDPFNNDDRLPKLLPCHHSFCKPCLLRMARDHPTLECPTCRQIITLPPGGVPSLQTNFYVTHMKDLLGDNSQVKIKGCRKHGNQELLFFCKTCELSICQDCTYTDHKEALGHVTQVIAIATQEQARLLEMEVNEAKETIVNDKSKIKTLEVEIGNLFAAKDKALQDIDATFDRYIEAINLRRQQLHEQLRSMYSNHRSHLVDEIESCKREETLLLGLVDQCEEATQGGNISDILAYRSKMAATNGELRNKRQAFDPGPNYIKFDHEEGRADFLQTIQCLGGLFAKKPLPSVVKFNSQRATAGLFTTMSFTVQSFGGEDLSNIQVDVEIQDIFDDNIPALIQPRPGGRYEMTFRPQVSGMHKVKVRFLESAILSETVINVQSNNPVARIGVRGQEDGQMEYPRAVTVDQRNHLYVVDTGNNRIQKYDKAGQFLYDFPISVENADISSCGIIMDHARGMLICPEVCLVDAEMAYAHAVLLYTAEGQLKQRLVYNDLLRRALSIAVNSLGQLIIADYELNTIFMFDRHGRAVKKFGQTGSGTGHFNHPTFVAVGENDCIVVSDSDNHRIQVFDRAGGFLYQFGTKGSGKGQFNMPFGVTCDNHGNILVVDGGNKRIQIFKTGGDFVGCLESVGDKLNAPRGIAVTTDGYVVVADRDNHCIKKYKYLLCTSI